MARPKNADPEETQRRILDAAVDRFGSGGVKGTSLRTIAADAGVTFATVHHYFGSKADLFDRCLATAYDRLRGLKPALAEAFGCASPPAERVRKIVEAAFDYARDHAHSTRFLLRVTLYDEVDHPRRRGAQAEYLDVASAMLAPMVERPAAELRVPLQGLMFLLSRTAVLSSRDLEVIAGGPEVDPLVALREYVADVAVHTLTRGAP